MALTKVTGDFIETGSITQGHLHSSHGITTSHITEGDKLFFTNARVDSRVGSLSTSDLSEGTNLYFTNARVITALTAGDNIAIASNGTISSTDTNTTYSVGDGGLTQKNFTTTLKNKLDGIAASATNVTNTNQLTNGAGFITSADGGNATTLDGIDSSQFLRSDADDTMSGTLTLTGGNGNAGSGLQLYETATNQYPQIFSNSAHEAMWNYRNSGSQWYVGIRSSSQLLGTTGFHFYNTTSGQTVGGFEVGGNFHTIGSVTSAGSMFFAGGRSLVAPVHSGNIEIRSNIVSASGLMIADSAGTFKMQLYGTGNDYGFLTHEWGSWDLRKNNNGELYLRVSGTDRTAIHSGNIGSQTVATAGNAGTLDGIDSSQFQRNDTGTLPLARMNTVLPTSGSYVWNNATTAGNYNIGLQTAFVAAAQGFPNYGSVIHVGARGGSDAGGDFQIFCGHGSNNGGNQLRVRNADNNATPSDAWTSWRVILDSGNYSSYALPVSGGTVTGIINTQRDIRSAGQIRATGWYGESATTDYTGLAFEIGVSAGEAYATCYNRDTGAYGAMNFNANFFNFNNEINVITDNSNGYFSSSSPARSTTIQGGANTSVLISSNTNTTGNYSELRLGNAHSSYSNYSPYIRGVQGAGIDTYSLHFGTSQGSVASTVMILGGATGSGKGTLSFGKPGNGSNTAGSFLSIEGNTDTSGEGGGRLFFREHNSSTAAADSYGMSLGYRGGGTSVTTAMNNTWTGLGAIGNGEWGMWGHNASATGTLIMSGDRAGSTVRIGGTLTTYANDIKRDGISYGGSIYYIALSGHLSGHGTNYLPTLKTNFAHLYFDVSGVYTGYISYNTGFMDQSDRSLKENIEDIPDALSKVMNLRGRYFTWINELQGDERQVGFIAQEVEEHLPEVVESGAGDIKAVAYGKLTALLVNAMKEQQAQIELLKQEVELLKQ